MKVVVLDYDPNWAVLFQREAKELKAIMEDNVLHIFHMGSTSVPGLKAKPIIDIMPVVRNLQQVDTYKEAFEAIGYEVLGECGIPGRKYMAKGGENRTHHVHIYQYDDARNIVKDLAFRDYLRNHPDAREAYGTLKSRLALEYPSDYMGYCRAKEGFVQQLSADAFQWYWEQYTD